MDPSVEQLLARLSETLDVSPGELREDSVSSDFPTWDSMSILDIMIMIESKYGVKVPLGEIARLVSVQGILGVLREAEKS